MFGFFGSSDCATSTVLQKLDSTDNNMRKRFMVDFFYVKGGPSIMFFSSERGLSGFGISSVNSPPTRFCGLRFVQPSAADTIQQLNENN